MKDWKSIDDQILLLKSRGMTVSEPVRGRKALQRFGYYRLSGYWYALLADKLRRKIIRPSVLPFLTRLGGGALVAMGVATATIRRS